MILGASPLIDSLKAMHEKEKEARKVSTYVPNIETPIYGHLKEFVKTEEEETKELDKLKAEFIAQVRKMQTSVKRRDAFIRKNLLCLRDEWHPYMNEDEYELDIDPVTLEIGIYKKGTGPTLESLFGGVDPGKPHEPPDWAQKMNDEFQEELKKRDQNIGKKDDEESNTKTA